MILTERDSLVIRRLAQVAATGLAGRVAVLETIRICGVATLALPLQDEAALQADVLGLATAVASLADPAVRANAQLHYRGHNSYDDTPMLTWPTPKRRVSTLVFEMRILAAGG